FMPSEKQEMRAELVYVGQARDGEMKLPGDVAGKLVAFSLTGRPDRAWNVRAQRALQAAEAAGAAGTVLILDPVVAQGFFAGMSMNLSGERSEVGPIPFIALSRSAAAPVLAAAGRQLDSLQLGLAGDVAPTPTGIVLTLRQPLSLRVDSVPNVIALLPGSDPALRDQYVVVSAHMDHVGVGRPENGDSIYNGADDNASGTTALLEIAGAFKALSRAPARSVVFLAVSGEEQGLRGSAFWVKHATVPFERVVADVNLDMVTRNAPDTIAVLGQELSSLGADVRQIAAAHPELKLTVQPGSPSPELPLIQMSDQYSFLVAGVPAVFFFSGMHGDLHRPTDEIARCDTDKGARVARLAFLLAHATAQSPARPAWTDEGGRSYVHEAAH
ncbi:MAG TPA: M28 family peptidase, partial [Longimicrobiales bacterium]